VKRIGSNLDIAPTVLDLLGLPVPESYQGRSLLDSQARVALFFTDYSLGWLGLRDQDWKFMYDIEGERAKLFDLRADPAERRNLGDRFPERVARYREHLLRWSATERHRIARGH
jgi:lipoteichoic acid synthase